MNNGITNNQFQNQRMTLYPLMPKRIEKDKRLEIVLFDVQNYLVTLAHILQDYVYMNTNSVNYPVLKQRTHKEFFDDFNTSAQQICTSLDEILVSFMEKNLDDYTLIMKLLDENAPIDLSWYHYQLIIIKRVLEIFIDRINQWKEDEDHYEGFYILEGDAGFLHDMCYDISSVLYSFYCFKAREYNEYVKKNQLRESDNVFVRYSIMTKMMKSHKAHSRTLLDSCEGVIHRTFFKNDVNAVPIMTSILRQIIELRFEELFGIQDIYTDESHSKVVKVVGSKYFELPELEKHAVIPVQLSAIKRIYGWASEFVHRGVSDYYWLIFFVKQYLLDFILGTVYMEESYYNNLKESIASLFGVTVNSILWRQPTNLIAVSRARLDAVRNKVKNKGYTKFFELESKREQEEMDVFIKKNGVYFDLMKKKPYIYKIDGKYYIICNDAFEECNDESIIETYQTICEEIEVLQKEYGNDIKQITLEIQDLKRFIPLFDIVRNYCDEREMRNRCEWEIKHRENDNCSGSKTNDIATIEKETSDNIGRFLEKINKAETENLDKQIVDLGWLSDQSIRYEVLMYNR